MENRYERKALCNVSRSEFGGVNVKDYRYRRVAFGGCRNISRPSVSASLAGWCEALYSCSDRKRKVYV